MGGGDVFESEDARSHPADRPAALIKHAEREVGIRIFDLRRRPCRSRTTISVTYLKSIYPTISNLSIFERVFDRIRPVSLSF